MAILVGNATTGEVGSGTSVTCAVPAGTVAGDMLVAVLSEQSGSPAAAQTGWENTGSALGTISSNIYYREASTSEPANYTFTGLNSGAHSLNIARLTGVDTANPLDPDMVGYNPGSTTNSITAPSQTTTTPDVVRIFGIGIQSSGTNRTIAPPAGVTKVIENTGSAGARRSYMFSETLTSAGATGTRTFSCSASLPLAGTVAAFRAAVDTGPTAPAVDAGADAVHQVDTAFTRTAVVDDGGAALTSQAWTIESGPAGVGTTLSTTADLTWTPTVVGPYVLRHTATNSAGTGFDDVTVTVGAAGGGTTHVVAWRGDTANPTLPAGDTELTATAPTAGAGLTMEIPYSGTAYDPNKVWQCNQVVAAAGPVEAEAAASYFDVTVNRTGDWIPKALRVKVARGGTSGTRGFRIRSTFDSLATDLLGRELLATAAETRPNLIQFSADLSAWGTVTGPVTFRFLQIADQAGRSLEVDDLEVEYEAPNAVIPTLVHRMVGIPTATTAAFSARTTDATTVRAQVSTDQTFATGIISGAAVTPDARGDSQLTVTGLTPGGEYWHRIGMTVDGVETFSAVSPRSFRTLPPPGPGTHLVVFGACDDAVDSATWATMAGLAPDLFFHLGDWPHDTSASSYADGTGTDLANIRSQLVKKIQAPNHAALYEGTPMSHTPSDHDAMENGASAATNPTAWGNWNTAVRELLPMQDLPATGVYRDLGAWGSVRYLQLDGRSLRTSSSALGAAQKQWLKDRIADCPETVIVLVQADSSWVGSGDSDQWAGVSAERNELADDFAASGKHIVMLAGDMHALAVHTSAPGGVLLLHAAPFDNSASQKGGPYTYGPYPASGTTVVRQFGQIQVTETATDVTFDFGGYSSDGVERLAAPPVTFALNLPVVLTVDGARSASRASRPLLTQSQPVTVDGARAASRATTAAVTQASPLTVSSARAAARTDSPLLGQVSALTTAPAGSDTRAGTPTLTQATPLVVQDAAADARADTATLGHTTPLATDSARAQATATVPALDQAQTLTVTGARSGTRTGTVSLYAAGTTLTSPARSATRTTTPLLGQTTPTVALDAAATTRTASMTVDQAHPLTVDSARSAATAGTPTLIAAGSTAIRDARAATTASAPLLGQRTALATQDARADTTTTTPLIDLAALVLLTDDARADSHATTPALTQLGLLVIAGARAPTRARTVPIGTSFPTAPPERTLTVPAESRVLHVAPESRTLTVTAARRTITA